MQVAQNYPKLKVKQESMNSHFENAYKRFTRLKQFICNVEIGEGFENKWSIK